MRVSGLGNGMLDSRTPLGPSEEYGCRSLLNCTLTGWGWAAKQSPPQHQALYPSQKTNDFGSGPGGARVGREAQVGHGLRRPAREGGRIPRARRDRIHPHSIREPINPRARRDGSQADRVVRVGGVVEVVRVLRGRRGQAGRVLRTNGVAVAGPVSVGVV